MVVKNDGTVCTILCRVCGKPIGEYGFYFNGKFYSSIYCSEECENVMRKSRGFMCDVCESINVKQIPSGIVSNIYSGILCRDCGRLIINHEVLFSGDK